MNRVVSGLRILRGDYEPLQAGCMSIKSLRGRGSISPIPIMVMSIHSQIELNETKSSVVEKFQCVPGSERQSRVGADS